jgi:hypothetical protein
MSSSIGQTPTFSCQQLVMKVLSWKIEILMKHDWVRDINCNIVNLQSPKKNYKEWQIMLGETFSVNDTTPQFTIHIEQDD